MRQGGYEEGQEPLGGLGTFEGWIGDQAGPSMEFSGTPSERRGRGRDSQGSVDVILF